MAEVLHLNINRKKEETAAGNLSTAKLELGRLRENKTRYTPQVDLICTRYSLLVNEKELMERQKEEAKTKLDEYAETVFSKYQEAINAYLHVFGASFLIVNVGRRYVGGSPSSSYQIEINDTAVDVGDQDTPSGVPCFNTTISDGDRSTLAFAFFMARLDQEGDLSHRIVVFDDPISSLDGHRRTCTQQQIVRLCQRAEQVIVMSHDPYFLRLVWESANDVPTKALCIRREGRDSTISEWDIEHETRGDYFQNYCALIEYLEHGPSGDLRDVARCIRPLLEGNFRMRFPGEFGAREWLGQFIGKVRDAEPGNSLYCLRPLLDELSDVNDFSKKYHHTTNPGAASEPINDTELQTYVNRTLRLISGILGATAP